MYSLERVGVEELLAQLEDIRAVMLQPTLTEPLLQEIHPNFRDSALNLLHYLSLRCHDLRPLQQELAALGLSSLGRAEACVLATVESVLRALHRLQSSELPADLQQPAFLDFTRGQALLLENAERLFGPASDSRSARIMVTMPGEAATNYALVESLLAQGMNGMRINCAHDDAVAWSGMIANLRRAETVLGKSCKVVMDLAGPKLRTGPVAPGPAVLKLKPGRDVYGCVISPARAWLVPAGDAAEIGAVHGEPALAVDPGWLARLACGSLVNFMDARGALRQWQVVEKHADACCVELEKTAYLVPGLHLHHQPAGEDEGVRDIDSAGEDDVCELFSVPPVEGKIRLHEGDDLWLLRDLQPGYPARCDDSGAVLEPARIGCTIPSVFDDVKAGEAIWFDDGKIGGVIASVEADRLHIRINQAGPRGSTLRADKGINLPDSTLRLPALTPDDLTVLPFVAQHADVVELSFANTARDVASLQQHLSALAEKQPGKHQPAIVIKVETRSGFENLPEMLLMAMRAPSCGVMIARGDLAVECGFERLAEVQEEILWLCEAAHVPVIWATQVLESLAKTGLPSRAEITDAAMGHRAECVMLNKGPHIIKALTVLDDILRRMQSHHAKKRTMLRPLRVASASMTVSV